MPEHCHPRIFLSPPQLSGREQAFVQDAFASNYIAPLGPMVDAFEHEFSDYTGIPHCVALSSGTAAMHVAMRAALNRPNRLRTSTKPLVLASTLTFIGSVTPAIFEGCELRFLDCDTTTWNMDPALLERELALCNHKGRLPAAVIPTDLYGQCCNLPAIIAICNHYDIPVICDSAEAMGAMYSKDPHRPPSLHAGCGAWASVYSFNGNKIITTSGGGMLASHDQARIAYARKLSQQARDPAPWYEHSEIGYNYRMSNVLAAIGRGQLAILDERVQKRRSLFNTYAHHLGQLPGIAFMPEPDWSRSNRWLTVILIDPNESGTCTASVREALEQENIEARPVWKPMHLQPVFKNASIVGGTVSERLFAQGLCLPSGSAMSDDDIARICTVVRQQVQA